MLNPIAALRINSVKHLKIRFFAFGSEWQRWKLLPDTTYADIAWNLKSWLLQL